MSMMHNSPPDDYDDDSCPTCGSSDIEWETCPDCAGECEFDLYDEDPINYAEGEHYETCPECNGRGGHLICHGCMAKAKTEAKN